jgi:hypothetical protein
MNTPDPSATEPARSGRWRIARGALLFGAGIITLLALVYTIENWRGKRAWENCRRELEAKGEVFDWAAYIPAPVPDEHNIFKAPKMEEWFVRQSFGRIRSNAPNKLQPFAFDGRGKALVVAEVRIVAPGVTDRSWTNAVLRFDDPAAPEQAAKLLNHAIGPCAIGASSFILLRQPLNEFNPLQVILQADPVPSLKELKAFFPKIPVTNSALAYSEVFYWTVDPVAGNVFRVSLKSAVYGAADYLASTEPLTADFDLLRKALERPFARIEGDYERPYLIPIPDFLNVRTVAQTLSQRAQCYLLLGEPEAAWRELALIHELCRLLLAKPSGKPMTLVAAMIYTAVAGLYTGIVEDGLRLHAWREPQLLGIEQQLKDIDLLGPVVEAFRAERAATCRTIENTKSGELARLFDHQRNSALFRLTLSWMPRGWLYQNMVIGSQVEQEVIGSVDLTNHLIRPQPTFEFVRRMSLNSQQRSPYTFLTAIAVPNFVKALQTVARNQTLVNQAWIACGLERYRLARGQYPDRLDALSSQFVEKLPHDLIGGKPLNYRGIDGKGYVIHSVGWDERDNGGVPGKSRTEGDWVWELR